MVKRAFPSVRSRRLAVKGTTKQFYIGIRPLFTSSSSSLSSSHTSPSTSPSPSSSSPASSWSPWSGSTSPPVANSTPPSSWERSTERWGEVGDCTTRNWIPRLPATRPPAAR
ncbi:uncharacterized protein ACA1_054680 [Acanthamoeba castellanii str. Neff]|uniref:Uncharacterized protein n=1 Tax=Acanthamoeba castellanii (strain ATCC 30010 / Neff) TaxID=1257118 RepID=L8H668_ACACF|nr:uncharacterized protein ACA1_054680 [Acanthamoeba castellanii str. Neff]ELR20722.1 hypothetical protein ACA1_054680 [Acanthamoeba castellanii str. Neff]